MKDIVLVISVTAVSVTLTLNTVVASSSMTIGVVVIMMAVTPMRIWFDVYVALHIYGAAIRLVDRAGMNYSANEADA